jgi:hypothetical protein
VPGQPHIWGNSGRRSEGQAGLDPAEWSEEWVTWEGVPEFSEGIFVARVHGASMEPLILLALLVYFDQPQLPHSL